jgi:hypothetical protein
MTTPAGVRGMDDAYGESHERNWIGLSAFIAGALGLSILAIPLGHLGLAAVKNGAANNRAFALAGTILGYIGLVAAAALAAGYVWIFAPAQDRDVNDINARVDVTAVGREIALYVIDEGTLPTVVLALDGYIVDTVTVPAALETDRTLAVVETSATDWCVLLTYNGGDDEAVSYFSGTGFESGGACEAPEPLPGPSPSPEPSASPGASGEPAATASATP